MNPSVTHEADGAVTTALARTAEARRASSSDRTEPEAPIRDLRKLPFAHDVVLIVR